MASARTVNATDALVEFALAAEHDEATTAPLVRTLVDTVGVALPGAGSDVLVGLRRWATTAPSPGPSTVWGWHEAVSPSRAALMNGTSAHALDFDDASPTTPLHASAVVWPAVLAVAEARGSSWVEVLAAVHVGQASARALCEVLPGDTHYARGWHTTATAGRLAATAAVARLAGLDEERTRHALGLAATTAAGLLASFGTMAKPLHAGQAARDAVDAVDLAAHGITASAEGVDAFLTTYGVETSDPGPRLESALVRWAADWPRDVSVKRYPSCYGTHRAVDAALDVRALLGDDAASAERVTVEVHPASLRPLITRAPVSALEARFSLEHTVASALVDGGLDLASFCEEAVARPAVVTLRERVVVVSSPQPPGGPDLDGAGYARVRVDTGNRTGDSLVTVTRGDARNPVTDHELDAKLLGCAAAAEWSDEHAAGLLEALREAGTTTSTAAAFAALRRAGEGR